MLVQSTSAPYNPSVYWRSSWETDKNWNSTALKTWI